MQQTRSAYGIFHIWMNTKLFLILNNEGCRQESLFHQQGCRRLLWPELPLTSFPSRTPRVISARLLRRSLAQGLCSLPSGKTSRSRLSKEKDVKQKQRSGISYFCIQSKWKISFFSPLCTQLLEWFPLSLVFK